MKILIVRSSGGSSWGSCRVISPNLQETYKLLADKFTLTWFDIPTKYVQQEVDTTKSYIIDLAIKIKAEKPDKIVFVDHFPNPAEILINLSLVTDLELLPPLLFHIYGDFTYFSKDWLALAPKLINHPVKFLAASCSQKKLLSYFCVDANAIEQFCFPVDSKEFFFDAKARLKLRSELNLSEQDTVILYTGRISLQKNVDILLKEYLKFIKNSNCSVHLWIVGAFDDIGAPFMGVETAEGYMYSKLENMLAGQPEVLKSKIKFFGIQDKEKLREIKSASDLFISLSLYHDEDYGMSPAEALACGLPTLLTDWGGYSSFASTNWSCQLIPVSITEFGLQIKTSRIKSFFEQFTEHRPSLQDRKKWSDVFLSQFSIAENASKLNILLNSNFNLFDGFNWTLAPFSQQYGKSFESKNINANTGPSDRTFYNQVYKNYISMDQARDDKNSDETIQWMSDYIKCSEGEPVSNRSFHHFLKPFSLNYFSPHSPTLLLDEVISSKTTGKKICTLRDGLIPLVLFFERSAPELFSGEIAIHKNLWFLVPDRWKKKVLFYEIKPNIEFSKSHLPDKIFIAGMLNYTFSDPEEFEKNLISLNETLGKENVDKMQIIALLPNKESKLWGKWPEESLLKFSRSIFSNIKVDINFSDWQNLQTETNLKNCLYFEINQDYFVQDSFVTHFALSRGAGLLKPGAQADFPADLIQTQKLSLYHSINYYRPNFLKIPCYVNPYECEYFEYYKRTLKSHPSHFDNSSTYLESWVGSYLKKFYKLYPPDLTIKS